jgi:allantoate deiminase
LTDAETVMERCDQLAACSEEPDRLTRPFASAAMRRAHELVGGWMREAGLEVRRDNIGNLRGRSGAPGAPTLLLGSHLDSVRGAGKYDGPLGVLVALAAVQRVRREYAVEVLAFADEEGLRYGTTYLGSRAVAGTFDSNDLGRTDGDGITMAEAIRTFGGDPARIGDDRWRGDSLGYVEVHIEQGPVLEVRGLSVGVVSAIAGQSRHNLVFKGEAGHAGTVPMDRRRDALVAASIFVQEVDAYARGREGLVATVGQLSVQPGAANVIPGQVTLSLDVRHASNPERIVATSRLLDMAAEVAQRRNVTLTAGKISENDAVACDASLVRLMSEAVVDNRISLLHLSSGAGHDAVVMAGITRVAMLFVRCKGGVSHQPAESVTTEDVGVAIDVASRFLELVGER